MAHKSTTERPVSQPVIGRYRLLTFLHKGKNKSVYQAVDIHTEKLVALKLLRLDYGQEDKQARLQLFNRYMEEVIALEHPHVFPILDFGKMTSEQEKKYDYVYTVMPIAAERSLDIWLNNYQPQRGTTTTPLTLGDIRQLIQQMAQSLQYAHDKNILHLGIKQTNLLIQYKTDGKRLPPVALSDFGMNRFMNLSQHLLSDTEVSYATAPELVHGQPVAASDQYALAALAYELLTSAIYIPEGQNRPSIAALFSPEKQTTHLTPAVEAVLQRALADVPDTRYPSVAAFSEAFEQAIRQGEPGENIHVMLGITHSEALAGTSYPLTLADKQQVTVTIPPDAQIGQIVQIARAGHPSRFGGPRGSLIATLAIRPNPDENRQMVEQLRHLSSRVQELQAQPTEMQQQMHIIDRKVTSLLNSDNDEELTIDSVQDVVPYVKKHVSPGLAMVLASLTIILILISCTCSNSLRSAIVSNGNSNIAAISTLNAQLTATANARSRVAATTTARAGAKATAVQAKAVQAAAIAQVIPPQYDITLTKQADLVFHDLNYTPYAGGSWGNSGQWSKQNPNNSQSCYFDEQDTFYHATMVSEQTTPHFCQTSGGQGTITTGSTFVIQVQLSILYGDVGGMVFSMKNKSFCYFYIDQNGHYEIGVNGIPFSTGKGMSSAIHTGTGPSASNLIAAVVNGKSLTFYANLKPILHIQGVQLNTSGNVAVIARSDGSPTDIGYQDIKIWQY